MYSYWHKLDSNVGTVTGSILTVTSVDRLPEKFAFTQEGR